MTSEQADRDYRDYVVGQIMAKHANHHAHPRDPDTCAIGEGYASEPPCLAYRLAAEVKTLRAAQQRVRDLADKWEHGALRWADPLPVPPELELILAALDGAES